MFLAAAPTGVLTAGPTLKQIYGKGVAYLWKNEGVAPLRELLYIAHFANSPLGHISSTPVCRLQCIGSVSAWVGAGNGSFKREGFKVLLQLQSWRRHTQPRDGIYSARYSYSYLPIEQNFWSNWNCTLQVRVIFKLRYWEGDVAQQVIADSDVGCSEFFWVALKMS